MKHGGQSGAKQNGPARAVGAPFSKPAVPNRSNLLTGLQQTHGNRFVASALSVQRKCDCGGTCSKCKGVQRKGEGPAGQLTPGLSSYLSNPGGGQTLSSAPEGGAQHLGLDTDGVRIHNDSRAHSASKSLGAQAMTVGSNIFFSAGRFQPGTPNGNNLLSHELTHVAQQRNGSVGTGLVENPGLEKQADDVAAGRASSISTVGKKGVQRKPENPPTEQTVEPAKKQQDDEDSAGSSAATKKDVPAELKVLDLLPASLRPDLQSEPTAEERIQKMLSDDAKAADRAKGITHLQNKPSHPSASPEEPKSVDSQDLVIAARTLLTRCNRDQAEKGDPLRQPDEDSKNAPEKTTGQQIKDSVEACLDTPEGEAFTAKAKAYLLSSNGAPVTVGAVGALLANFAATGKIAYIPPIPLGKGAELSLEIDGSVDKPDQAMLKLKVTDTSVFGKSVMGALKTVGGGFAKLGGWIWQGLKAVGGAIATFAGWVWTGVKWLARKVFDRFSGILGRVVEWMLKLPFRLARLFKTLIEGVAALRPWSLKFWESLGKAGTWLDALKWLGTFGLELAEVAGVGEIVETAADLGKINTRTLRDDERAAASLVFGTSIPLDLVRIDESAITTPSGTDAYTTFHTINSRKENPLDILIHELTHVWQYEMAGAIYMPQAIHAQSHGGYMYGGPAELQVRRAAGSGILSFNREQQAQIVQDFFRLAQGRQPESYPGTKADQPLYAHFVQEVSSHKEQTLASLSV